MHSWLASAFTKFSELLAWATIFVWAFLGLAFATIIGSSGFLGFVLGAIVGLAIAVLVFGALSVLLQIAADLKAIRAQVEKDKPAQSVTPPKAENVFA